MASALNLSTFATLYGYGYHNVYELKPLLDVDETRLPLVSLLVDTRQESR